MQVQAPAYLVLTRVQPSGPWQHNKRDRRNYVSIVGVHDKFIQRAQEANCGSMIATHG
jgi:hypothetical protein